MSNQSAEYVPLGDFIDDLERKLKTGASADSCVMCGTATVLLHPVQKAWACASCHQPPDFNEAETNRPHSVS